jgi:hypothetical protein
MMTVVESLAWATRRTAENGVETAMEAAEAT